MSRKCSICINEKRTEIEGAFLKGDSYRTIAHHFKVSADAFKRHVKNGHLSQELVKSKETTEIVQADNLLDVLRNYQRRVELLFDACDRWLRDPNNPDQYDLGPRDDEISVTYIEDINGLPRSTKEKLSVLLERINKSGRIPTGWEYKHADPRELILKTAGQLNKQLELLAQLSGKLQGGSTVNLFINSDFILVKQILVEELKDFPEQRAKISKRFEDAERASASA